MRVCGKMDVFSAFKCVFPTGCLMLTSHMNEDDGKKKSKNWREENVGNKIVSGMKYRFLSKEKSFRELSVLHFWFCVRPHMLISPIQFYSIKKTSCPFQLFVEIPKNDSRAMHSKPSSQMKEREKQEDCLKLRREK